MKNIACIYFEGDDSKIALFTKKKNKITMIKAESLESTLTLSENSAMALDASNGSGQNGDYYNYDYSAEDSSGFDQTFIQSLNKIFWEDDISKYEFIPILSEPSVYYRTITTEKKSDNKKKKQKKEIVQNTIELEGDKKLSVSLSEQSNYLQVLNSLADINNRKRLKIPVVKSAELSLVAYINRKYELDTNAITLVLYVGKEYSRLIFLRGDELLHIGSKLSVGKNSFNSHSVIVSKILLEMEQSSINKINNILICGEDTSVELKSELKTAYPESRVYKIGIEGVEFIDESSNADSSFIITSAVAEEYFYDYEDQYSKINLLPDYIREEQKLFQFSWQSYLMMLLIFLSAFYFAFNVVSNRNSIEQRENEIQKLMLVEQQNREAVNKIKSYENKIKNVDRTRAIMNQLSSGMGVLSSTLKDLAIFGSHNRNYWISNMSLDENKKLNIHGFTLSRRPIKALADFYNRSLLQKIVFEPLRELRVFKFSIDAGKINNGSVKDESQK